MQKGLNYLIKCLKLHECVHFVHVEDCATTNRSFCFSPDAHCSMLTSVESWTLRNVMWKGHFNCFLSNHPENLLVMAHFAHNVCLNVSCNNAVTSAGNKRKFFYMKLEFRNSKSKARYFAFSLCCLSLSLPLSWDTSQVVYTKSTLQLGVKSLKNLAPR
jgi:hypothetical protein